MNKNFSIITAITKNYGIGLKSDLPWKNFKEDMKFFKKTTENNIVIMGYNTFKSMHFKPLPNRINYIINNSIKDKKYINGIIHFNNLDIALDTSFKERNENLKKIYVIGGEKIYKEAINNCYCDKIYITKIDKHIQCDRYFPEINNNYYLYNIIDNGKTTIIINNNPNIVSYSIEEYIRTHYMFVNNDFNDYEKFSKY